MNTSHPRILCIEAEAHTVDLFRGCLKDSDIECEVTWVKTGRDAFRRLNSEDFDLCVLANALPDMNGVQLCSLMRHMGSEVPMLLFTATERPVDPKYAEAAGAAAYLLMPDEIDRFLDTVARLSNGSGRLQKQSHFHIAKAA
jgi:CheY-like chemotaxis protein